MTSPKVEPLGLFVGVRLTPPNTKEFFGYLNGEPPADKCNLYTEAALQSAREEGARLEREKVAAWMIDGGYATGHGDTVEDLLREMEWHCKEKGARMAAAPELSWPEEPSEAVLRAGCEVYGAHVEATAADYTCIYRAMRAAHMKEMK